MADWRLFIADIVVLVGLAFVTLAIGGLIRIPAALVKLHAASKIVVIGVVMVLAASLAASGPAIITRATLVVILLMLTAPVSSHVLARLAVQLGEDRD